MTAHDDILAHQQRERKFLATPIGRAFHRFKNAYGRAKSARRGIGSHR